MRFATVALVGVAAAHTIDINWTHFAKVDNLVGKLIKSVTDKKVGDPGMPTFGTCDDDSGDFTLDAGQTQVTPAPPLVKNEDIQFQLVGGFANPHTVKNLHIHVDWNGSSLYDEDKADGTTYYGDYKFDQLKWSIPSYAPDGDYKVTMIGTEGDDKKKVLCISAAFSFCHASSFSRI